MRSVYHADGAKPAVLVMFDPVPQFKDLDASRDNYETDGIAVARLLVHHLPGGTVDVVLRELLTYRASLLRVTFKEGA